jgi:hypothetical protein
MRSKAGNDAGNNDRSDIILPDPDKVIDCMRSPLEWCGVSKCIHLRG